MIDVDSVQISEATLGAIEAHARREAPDESCGLLLGRTGLIVEAFATRNASPQPRSRYLIDPRDHFEAIRSARNRGLDVIGAYHSHPRGAAVPSETDGREAFSEFVFIIIGLGTDPAEVTAWRWDSGNFMLLPLVDIQKGPQKQKTERRK